MKVTIEELEAYLLDHYSNGGIDQSLFMKLVEEIGEVAEVLNKKAGRKKSGSEDLQAQLGNELADVIHYAIAIAALNDLDMNQIIIEKDKAASVKYNHRTKNWITNLQSCGEIESNRRSEFVKEIYNMKKVCLAVLPALTIVLELLPLGAVCIFATSPTERVKETFSYFSLTPFGYANFAPLITATLTVAIFLLSLFSLKKKGVLKALFVLSIITVVISLLPLMYGLNYYTLVGAFITVTLVIESILAKIQ